MNRLAFAVSRPPFPSDCNCDRQLIAQHRKVKTVNYPGLRTHPQYSLAREQMSGFGGMMSFELKGNEKYHSIKYSPELANVRADPKYPGLLQLMNRA